jgi:hypothetical protein
MYFYYCIIAFTVLTCLACSSKYSKKNHIITFILNDSLYVEKYKVFSGSATTSDSYSYYVTDSIHFRKYIGTEYHSSERLLNKIDSSEIKIYMEVADLIDYSYVYDTVKMASYNINGLIKEGKFE